MAVSKERRRNSVKRAESPHSILKIAPIAALLMPTSGLFVLIALSLCIINTPSPVSLALPVAIISVCIGSAIGGCFCMKALYSARGYVCAAVSAIAYTLLLLLARSILSAPSGGQSSAMSLVLSLSIPASSLIGAAISGKSAPKKRKRKR